MIDLDFVRGLILAIDESGIDSIEISRGGTRIRIAKTAAPAAVSAAPALPLARRRALRAMRPMRRRVAPRLRSPTT
jgi:hypothetical protein